MYLFNIRGNKLNSQYWMWAKGGLVANGLCNTTWWFYGTCYYISIHKGSCRDKVRRQKGKRQELSGTRLDRLAKGAFMKIGSMAWDVWIHTCSHGFLGCGYSFEGFHGCIAMVFLLNNKWWWMLLEARFFSQWGFPTIYLVSQFFCGYVVYSLACGFQLHICWDLLWVMWK